MQLEDKVAIVTGAAKGIGRGIATEFASEGAKVVVADVDEGSGRETANELTDEGEAMFFSCDVSQEQDVRSLIDAAVDRYGSLDILVNNAGVGIYKSLTDSTLDDFERALAVNLRGPFLCSKLAVPHLEAADGGAIVNIASVHSVQNVGETVPYASSKGGVATLTRASAIDLAPLGIRVNAICPGWIDTPLIRGIFADADDPEGMREEVERRQLLGRLGRPEEVARAAVFLASDNASYVTGSLLFVDNGMTAQLETW